MNFDILTNDNYVLFAIKNYNNPQCLNMDEFNEDLARVVYIKRLFRKFHNSGDLRERLILNHLITFYNVFEKNAATRILFYKIENELHYILKTFLVYLSFLPEDIHLKEIDYDINSLELDTKIINTLREL